jgi:hypothetical protein
MRRCDQCSACCQWLGVPELQKKAGDRCKHVCATGCGIYDSRPRSCQVFECLWLKGELPEEARPDKLGAIFAEARTHLKDAQPPIMVQETYLGVADDPQVWAIIQGFVKAGRKVIIAPPVA